MEENSKQITLHLLFCGRPQKLAGISAAQIREGQSTFPGQGTPRGSLFLPAARQGRLIAQCHLLLSSSLLHAIPAWTPPQALLPLQEKITQRTRLIFPNSDILALPLLFRMDILRLHRIYPIQRIQQVVRAAFVFDISNKTIYQR